MPSADWNRAFWTANLKQYAPSATENHYGDQWGTPEDKPHLQVVRDNWLLPFVSPDKTALEIGSGGGRWTEFLLGTRALHCLDINPVMLDYLRQRFGAPDNLILHETEGTNIPGIQPESLDFVFSFGTFVHLDPCLINAYLEGIRPLLKVGADVVLQYADKTKEKAAKNIHFANTDALLMERLAYARGYQVVRHDTTLLDHSNIIHLRRGEPVQALEPWPMNTASQVNFLAWPNYRSAEDLFALFHEYARHLVNDPSVCLCLRVDPATDGPMDHIQTLLSAAFQQTLGENDLQLLLLNEPMSEVDWPRLHTAVTATLNLPSSRWGRRAAFQAAVQVPTIRSGMVLQTLMNDIRTNQFRSLAEIVASPAEPQG